MTIIAEIACAVLDMSRQRQVGRRIIDFVETDQRRNAPIPYVFSKTRCQQSDCSGMNLVGSLMKTLFCRGSIHSIAGRRATDFLAWIVEKGISLNSTGRVLLLVDL